MAEAEGLSREDIRQIAGACRKAGMRLIPQINMLGHQSWGKTTFPLLRAHPDFDETPGVIPAMKASTAVAIARFIPKSTRWSST